MKTKSAFNGNYIEYESKGVKDKHLSPKEYLDTIRPYLKLFEKMIVKLEHNGKFN